MAGVLGATHQASMPGGSDQASTSATVRHGTKRAGQDRRVRGGHDRDGQQQERHEVVAAALELRRHHGDDGQPPQPDAHRGQQRRPAAPHRDRPVEQRDEHDQVSEPDLEEGNGHDQHQNGRDQYDLDRRRGSAQRFAHSVEPFAGRSCRPAGVPR